MNKASESVWQDPIPAMRDVINKAENAERIALDMADKLDDIKQTLKEIEREVKIDIESIKKQFNTTALTMERVLAKLDERDRQYLDQVKMTSETFNRFGNAIQENTKHIYELSLDSQKAHYLERWIYGIASVLAALIAGIGSLTLWFITKAVHL